MLLFGFTHFTISPLIPVVHFWLHHTVHSDVTKWCNQTITNHVDSLCMLACSSVSAERVGQGEVGGITHRVTCTWWLLGLAVKKSHGWDQVGWLHWQAKKTLLLPCRGWFLVRKTTWALSGCMTTESADYCVLVNEWWTWLQSRLCWSGLGFSFGVRAWTEMEIRCIKGMLKWKIGFKGQKWYKKILSQPRAIASSAVADSNGYKYNDPKVFKVDYHPAGISYNSKITVRMTKGSLFSVFNTPIHYVISILYLNPESPKGISLVPRPIFRMDLGMRLLKGSAWICTHAFVCVFNRFVFHVIGDWCTGPLYQVDYELTKRTLTDVNYLVNYTYHIT